MVRFRIMHRNLVVVHPPRLRAVVAIHCPRCPARSPSDSVGGDNCRHCGQNRKRTFSRSKEIIPHSIFIRSSSRPEEIPGCHYHPLNSSRPPPRRIGKQYHELGSSGIPKQQCRLLVVVRVWVFSAFPFSHTRVDDGG